MRGMTDILPSPYKYFIICLEIIMKEKKFQVLSPLPDFPFYLLIHACLTKGDKRKEGVMPMFFDDVAGLRNLYIKLLQ